jgi:hypothetical protein
MDLTNKNNTQGNREAIKVHPVKKNILKFLNWLSKGQKEETICKS